MKKITFILLLCISILGYSQTTAIPDANFEQALIDLGIDTDATINGSVATSDISRIKNLDVNNKNIADLTGIEDFTALTSLSCASSQLTNLDITKNIALTYLACPFTPLTSLDVSNNTALIQLYCFDNQLTSLDVSNNTALTDLRCYNNQLTSLDVSNNNALTELRFAYNQLTSLDVSNNTALTYLQCQKNQLTSLDITKNTALTWLQCNDNQLTSLDLRNGNNTIFSTFYAINNPNLTCIFVDDASYSAPNWTNIDAISTFVNDEAGCQALSVGDNAFELGISLYPNPANKYLLIEGNENPIFVSIFNFLGKEVLSVEKTNKVDVKGLSNGVYFIKISDGINQTKRKFVKN